MTNETRTISKGRRITSWILVGLLVALFLMGGVMSLTANPEALSMMAKYGLEGKNVLIGVGEIICALLFLIPRTSSLGVLLLSAYMGGAIATHMEHGEPYFFPAIILVIIWIAQWLRNPDVFSSFTKSKTGNV